MNITSAKRDSFAPSARVVCDEKYVRKRMWRKIKRIPKAGEEWRRVLSFHFPNGDESFIVYLSREKIMIQN